MNRIKCVAALLAAATAVLPSIGRSEVVFLPEMPKEGELPAGKVVYVDDGKCAKGAVKEVIGGSRQKAIPRQVRCVKRPGAPATN